MSLLFILKIFLLFIIIYAAIKHLKTILKIGLILFIIALVLGILGF